MTRLLLAGLVALGLAACGDTDDDTAADGGACTGGETVTVEIGDFAFGPDPVEVDRCDSVVWTNAHDQAHTSTGDGERSWNTGNLAPGATSEPIRFEDAGAHTYLCALHPFMEGTVQVS